MVEPRQQLTRPVQVRPVSGRDLQLVRGGRLLVNVPRIDFADHKLTVIVGPNGAGKTLLIKLLAGVLSADQGSVTWNDLSPSRTGYRRLSMVLQTPVLLRRSALANITFALQSAGIDRAEARPRALAVLEQAGLIHLAENSARLMSGGEKQRLVLARALAIDPEVLLLDEPVANVDPSSTLTIETMIADARDRGVTVVLVTHDLAQARRLADEILFMHRGEIVERGAASDFFTSPQTALARAFLNGEIIA